MGLVVLIRDLYRQSLQVVPARDDFKTLSFLQEIAEDAEKSSVILSAPSATSCSIVWVWLRLRHAGKYRG